MTENKLHVAVIFGGHFGEHEVSLMSARSVLAALDPAKYEVIQTGIKHECIRQYAVRACEAIDCAGMNGLIELAMERKADRDHTSHIYWSET